MTNKVFGCLILLLAALSSQGLRAAQLDWKTLPALPDEFGFGGPIVGVHNDALIVAGGANFPDGPPWSVGDKPPDKKVWHDRIFVLLPDATKWIDAGKLSIPLAYAPAISTDDGVYVLGGSCRQRQGHLQ